MKYKGTSTKRPSQTPKYKETKGPHKHMKPKSCKGTKYDR